MGLKAHVLLKQNIDALLKARHLKRKDLAAWCRRSESWLSQIFRSDERNVPLKYLDRIADFFRLETYQLFQLGVVPNTDRRGGTDRRTLRDRRVNRAEDILKPPPTFAELAARANQLSPEAYQVFAHRAEAALVLAEPSRSDVSQPDRPGTAGPPAAQASQPRGRPR